MQVVLQGQVQIGNGLRLYTLRRVYNKERAFAGSNGTGYFVRKVNVSRCVDQVEGVLFSVGEIVHLDGVAFNGDAAFPFEIHVI